MSFEKARRASFTGRISHCQVCLAAPIVATVRDRSQAAVGDTPAVSGPPQSADLAASGVVFSSGPTL